MTRATLSVAENSVTEAELSSVEEALREIDQENFKKRFLASISEWFLVLRLYRKVELSFLTLPIEGREKIQHRHRAILSTLMSYGEVIDTTFKECSLEVSVSVLGYSEDQVFANIRFLREKYQQWYEPMTNEESKALFGDILSEPSSIA
jgi:hypothetical protein